MDKKLEKAMDELKNETPPRMNTMLKKQPRSEAIQRKSLRERMPVVDVPPPNPCRMHVSWLVDYSCQHFNLTILLFQ